MRGFLLGVGVALVAAVGVALAGEGKCTYGTQECLDMMATRMKESGWVGVELEREAEGISQMTVTKVVEDSPAQQAGIKAGDVLVAIGGITLEEGNHEKLQQARAAMKPGDSVTWTMLRGQSKREVAITLGAMPADLLARYIGQHMLDHATTELAAN